MNLRKIYQNLGMTSSFEEEIMKTNNRLYALIEEFNDLLFSRYQGAYQEIRKEFFKKLGMAPVDDPLEYCIEFGTDDENVLRESLYKVQVLLDCVMDYDRWPIRDRGIVYSDRKSPQELLYKELKEIINELPLLEIGYVYRKGAIIKTGAKELDKKLLIENLEWLKNYPEARENFSNALKYYLSKKYRDAITNAYSALEGVAKVLLNTSKRLDDDEIRKKLVNRLDLESHFSQILYHFCKIAHEFSSRHGSKKRRKKLKAELVEFYIHITGVFIRLISQRIQ